MSGVCKMEGKPIREGADLEAEALPVLSRDSILGATDLPIVSIPVPEWGGAVCVRTMTGRERDAFETSLIGEDKRRTMRDFRARFAALVVCDPEGKLLFTAEDIDALTAKSSAALDRIYDAGKELNRIGPEEEEALASNFGRTQGEDSSSD